MHTRACKPSQRKEHQPRPLAQQLQTQAPPPPSALAQWGTLTHRFARILCADFNTLGVALLQAVVMSNLICLVLREMPSVAFLLVVSALWFGCAGAAQQLVRERSIYRRERTVNLRLDTYLMSKFCLLALIGAVQCALMLGIVRCWKDDIVWPIMLPSLILASWNGVAIGLIISCLAGSADRATSIVPWSLLPQITSWQNVLIPIADMNPATSVASHAIAARWANQAMEVSMFEGKTINPDLLKDEANLRPLWNLHPDYDLGSVEGRQRFLQENDGKTIRRARRLGIDAAVLVGFLVVQLTAVAVLLRRLGPYSNGASVRYRFQRQSRFSFRLLNVLATGKDSRMGCYERKRSLNPAKTSKPGMPSEAQDSRPYDRVASAQYGPFFCLRKLGS